MPGGGGGPRRSLIVHDVHHLLTGYGTDFLGELELAGWELGSGGCSWSFVFWADRTVAALIGLVVSPKRVFAAIRRGRTCRNLFGRDTDEVLGLDFEVLKRGVLG